MDDSAKTLLTVSGLLFGFLFTAFWWILNRELAFPEDQRHFKPATGMLLVGMLLLGVFGIIVPLEQASRSSPDLLPSYHGVVLALVAIFGYMLVDLGHYRVYQWPKYTTKSELLFLVLTLAALGVLSLYWWVL
jgi:hypothetical protein